MNQRREMSLKKININDYKDYYVSQNGEAPSKGAVKVTSFGTTTLLFDDGENQILIDGLLTRPSLFRVMTSTIKTDKALVDHILEKQRINRLKAIFVSHSHYDHVLDVAYIANKTNAKIYGSESTLNIGRGGNVQEDKLTLFIMNEPVAIGKFKVTVLPSKHSKPNRYNNDIGVVIEKPLKQPAKMRDYTEGGSFEFLVQHSNKKILVRPCFNYIEGSLDNIKADVLFLGIAGFGKTDIKAKDKFYEETVKKVKPNLVIPIHWDNFFLPLNKPLKAPIKLADNLPVGLDYMIKRTNEDQISFKILQGYQSVVLFKI
jgi:L-ascorbate metabolism protein UlaG (beta-lactamase superfamily)